MMLALALAARLACAQTADEPWRTVRTEHFVVHYPLAAEAWTLEAASRLEELHARVTAEVGYTPDGPPIRVRVVDPFSVSNGSALPFLGHPRIELWATPPEADSVIGHFRSWSELLLVHEDTHVVHLVRPSRNPAMRALGTLTGVGPLTAGAPRWVIEGYATVVEGRLTGLGRPHGDVRPATLRSLALQGALPAYGQLDGNGRFGGMADAYLVGSAFLEWLEKRSGEGSLRSLWARMSAREIRSFEEAFVGVFGDAPDVLYGRFTAELTADAVAMDRAEPAPEGTLFEVTRLTLDPPARSPDGTALAVAGWSREEGSVLRVWSTSVDSGAIDRLHERIGRVLLRDPDDVPPVEPAHPPHEVLHELKLRGVPIRDPRWMPDGASVLFTAGYRDAGGRLRWDLARWWPESGRVERLTHRADLRTADPEPGGTTAIAVRQEWGRTSLVRVDLATGEREGVDGTSSEVVDGPRVSRDGRWIAWLEARREGWTPVVLDTVSHQRVAIPATRRGGAVAQLAWAPDGTLLAVQGDEGSLDAVVLWRDGQPVGERRASLPGGILGLEAGEGKLWATTLTPHGHDLHEVPLSPEPLPPRAPAVALVGRPPTPEAPAVPARTEVEPAPYGLGPVEIQPLVALGGTSAGGVGQVELAVRVGDPIGRNELLVVGSVAAPDGGAAGGRASVVTRAMPVTVGADAWAAGDDRLGARRAGGAVSGARTIEGSSARLRVELGALSDRSLRGPGRDLGDTELADRAERALLGPAPAERDLGFGEVGLSVGDRRGGALGAWATARGQVGVLDPSWRWGEASAGVALFRGGGRSRATYTLGGSTRSGMDGFVLGGVPDTVVPDAAQAFRVIDPAFAPGAWTGSLHDRVDLALGEPLSLFATRHRFGQGALGSSGFTAAGLRVDQALEAQPWIRLPATRVGAGVACRLEGPGLGFDRRPCQELGDWAAWGALTFGAGTE